MGAGRGRRTGIILIVLILVVVLIAVGALFFLQGGLGGGGDTAETPAEEVVPPTPTPPPTLQVIVANRDIPRGARLTTDDVTVMQWPILPEAPPPVGVLVVGDDPAAAGLDQVNGRIARVDILNGQPILDFMLTPGDEPADLADTGGDAALLTPSGMVTVAMPISRLSSVAYAVRPGDHVDVMMSFIFMDVDEEFHSLLPNTGVIVTNDTELATLGMQQYEYIIGREENGVFGTTLLVMPSGYTTESEQTTGEGETESQSTSNIQIPRRTTQMMIDNAIVVGVGEWPLARDEQPIVITPAPPTPTPEPAEGEAAEGEEGAEAPPESTPTPVPPPPDVITLAMPRQDALVLKYATEAGADIDLALRSALDDDIVDIVTDPVTLDYIINTYNVPAPEKLPVALDPRIDVLVDIGAEEDTQSDTTGGEGQ